MNALIKSVTMEYASIPKEVINANAILDTNWSVMEHVMMSMNAWMKVSAMPLAHVSTLMVALIVSVHLVTKVIQNKEDVWISMNVNLENMFVAKVLYASIHKAHMTASARKMRKYMIQS